MSKKHAVAASLVLAFGIGSAAEAKTIPLGEIDPGTTLHFGDTIGKHTKFKDFVKFSLDGPASITASFSSFFNIIGSSFKVELEEKTKHGSWMDVVTGLPQGTTYSFAELLQSGSYRWEVVGTTGHKYNGFWQGSMSVAAVPEADVWTMLLIGGGLVGYQLRRKQNALSQPPIA